VLLDDTLRLVLSDERRVDVTEHRTGPVRSESARLDILAATASLFSSRGYDHLTMEGIAAAAGVGKQTIYRWWGSKGALVAECLLEGLLLPERFTPADTGDLRADLVDWLRLLLDTIEKLGGGAFLRSLVVAAAESDDVGARLQEGLGVDEYLVARLRSAVDAGDLPAEAPLAEIGEALVGAVILRSLSRTTTLGASPERLVDAVLGGRRA
jgi:AcrR family transcriptional regulator